MTLEMFAEQSARATQKKKLDSQSVLYFSFHSFVNVYSINQRVISCGFGSCILGRQQLSVIGLFSCAEAESIKEKNVFSRTSFVKSFRKVACVCSGL